LPSKIKISLLKIKNESYTTKEVQNYYQDINSSQNLDFSKKKGTLMTIQNQKKKKINKKKANYQSLRFYDCKIHTKVHKKVS